MEHKDYTPLLSDADLRGETRAKGIHHTHFGTYRSNRLMQPAEVRDIYEARHKEDQASIAALRAEVEGLKDVGKNMMQRIIDRVPNIDLGTDADLALYNAVHAWTDALTTKTD